MGGRAHSLMWSAASAATCREEDAHFRIFLCFDQRGCSREKLASQGRMHEKLTHATEQGRQGDSAPAAPPAGSRWPWPPGRPPPARPPSDGTPTRAPAHPPQPPPPAQKGFLDGRAVLSHSDWKGFLDGRAVFAQSLVTVTRAPARRARLRAGGGGAPPPLRPR